MGKEGRKERQPPPRTRRVGARTNRLCVPSPLRALRMRGSRALSVRTSHLAGGTRRNSAKLGANTVRKRTRALEPTIAPKDAVGRRSDGAHPQQLLPSCGRWLAEHELLRALWPLRD